VNYGIKLDFRGSYLVHCIIMCEDFEIVLADLCPDTFALKGGGFPP